MNEKETGIEYLLFVLESIYGPDLVNKNAIRACAIIMREKIEQDLRGTTQIYGTITYGGSPFTKTKTRSACGYYTKKVHRILEKQLGK